MIPALMAINGGHAPNNLDAAACLRMAEPAKGVPRAPGVPPLGPGVTLNCRAACSRQFWCHTRAMRGRAGKQGAAQARTEPPGCVGTVAGSRQQVAAADGAVQQRRDHGRLHAAPAPLHSAVTLRGVALCFLGLAAGVAPRLEARVSLACSADDMSAGAGTGCDASSPLRAARAGVVGGLGGRPLPGPGCLQAQAQLCSGARGPSNTGLFCMAPSDVAAVPPPFWPLGHPCCTPRHLHTPRHVSRHAAGGLQAGPRRCGPQPRPAATIGRAAMQRRW